MTPDVVLLADAGPGIGWGHAVRQLALAEALVAKRVRTLFVTRTREALGLDWPCPTWVVFDVEKAAIEARTLVYDLPEFVDTPDIWTGENILQFADYGPPPPDYLAPSVCPNFAAHTHDWTVASFLGPRWAPLRKGFASVPSFRKGAIPENRSGLFVYGDFPALPKGTPASVYLKTFGGESYQAAHTIGMCVAALVPPSMVALECLAVGTPVVLYVPGPKWQPIADAMEAAGVARIWSGNPEDHTLACVLADDGLRRRMAEAGRDHVDGRGAERLAEWLADA